MKSRIIHEVMGHALHQLELDALITFNEGKCCPVCESKDIAPKAYSGRGAEGTYTDYDCGECALLFVHNHAPGKAHSVRWWGGWSD